MFISVSTIICSKSACDKVSRGWLRDVVSVTQGSSHDVTFNNSTSWIFESSTGDIFEILWGRTEEREDEDEEQVRWSALSEEEEEEDKEEERVPESTLSEEEEEEDGEEDGVNNGETRKS